MRGIQVQVDDEPGDEAGLANTREHQDPEEKTSSSGDSPHYYLINKVKERLDSLPHIIIDLGFVLRF